MKFGSGNDIQAVIVANTNKEHDCMKPKALPRCQTKTTVQSQVLSELNIMGIVELDFTLVGEVKMIEIESKCIGVSFFNTTTSECIASALFPKPFESDQFPSVSQS